MRRKLASIFSVFVLLMSMLVSTPMPTRAAVGLPAELEKTTALSGLADPTGFRFAPNGDMYIAEKGGAIKRYSSGIITTLGTLPTPTDYERGLLGLELDQNFATNHYIYASYTHTDGYSRLSRFTITGNTLDMSSEMIFYKSPMLHDIYHNFNDVHAGPDGEIWLSTGDDQVPGDAQSLQSPNGKMLRFDTDGTSANDNPWHGDGSKVDDIYALGFRNPFRFTFLPNGNAVLGDVGLDTTEEINIVEKGANYGWPLYEGNCGSCGYVNPVFSYPHNGTNASISALGVYTGSTFGPAYTNALFYGDYARGTLRYLTLDSGFDTVISDNAFDDAAGTIVDIHTGPDGNLYYASIFEGTITKIAPSGGNRAPVAEASANPIAGLAPLSVNFSSAGSSDPEGTALTYAWNFGDGATSTAANPTHVYTVNGKYAPTLTVSDGLKSAVATTSVTVGNRLPTATIDTPLTGTKYNAGDTISYSGSGTDPEDGVLPASAFSWKVVLHHAEHIHPYLGPLDGSKSGTFTIGHETTNEANTWYAIELTVTDSGGLTSVVSRDITPNLATMTINSNVPGGQFTVDGRLFTSQYVSQEVVGVDHGVSVTSPQTVAGKNYRFRSWSDGGAQTHPYRVPATSTTLTASLFEITPIPSPWVTADIGAPALPGRADYDVANNAYVMDGGGNDIWGTTDEFRYMYQPLTGDGEIVTRVNSQTPTDPWAKAGIMFKSSAAVGSPYVMVAVTPGHGIIMQHNFSGDIGAKPAFAFPVWLKLKRAANIFTGYYSSDGINWTTLATATVPISSSATLGTFVMAHTDAALSTSFFDKLTVTAGALPPNTAPVAQNQSQSTVKDTALAVKLGATDDQGDPLTYAVVAAPAHGSLTGTAPNLTYTPALGYTGPDSFTFKANDGKVDSNIGTVYLNVTGPFGALPAPWLQSDVGTVTPGPGSGGYDPVTKTFSVKGGGYDVWDDRDDFHYVYQPLTGDGEIIARVASQTRTNPYAKAGIMIKQSGAPFAPYAMVAITPDNGYQFQWNFLKAAAFGGAFQPQNAWVKLKRVGNAFTAYTSANGLDWTQVGATQTIAMTASATIGLFVTSHNSGALGTATFDNVKVGLPNNAPVAQDKSVTTTLNTPVAATLTATDADGDPLTYSVVSSPAHGSLSGTAPNLTYTPATGYTGADTFTYKANDGKANSNTATVSLTVNAAAGLPAPWLQTDIGTVTPAPGSGSFNVATGTYTVTGGGYDVWDDRDDFHYVYQTLNGDGQIIARVTSQTASSPYAKAGVMIKDSTTPFSPYAFMGITPGIGYQFQWTFLKQSVSGGTYTLPNGWVKLTRVGNLVTSYKSTDGINWTQVGQNTVTLNPTATIGLFVTSHNSGALSTATFDNVQVTP